MRLMSACLLCCCALQEVIVVEDENGNIVRETMKDNDVLMQYRTMRETLIYLSHLDYEDTELQMLEKLRGQMSGSWTWNGLNTLCWAIGSISGSMHVSGWRLVARAVWVQQVWPVSECQWAVVGDKYDGSASFLLDTCLAVHCLT
jgi:hypothetical protein